MQHVVLRGVVFLNDRIMTIHEHRLLIPGLKLLYVTTAVSAMMTLRFINAYFVAIGLDTMQIGLLQTVRAVCAFAGEFCWASVVERGASFKVTVACSTFLGVTLLVCIPCVSSFPAILALYSAANFGTTWIGLRDSRTLATLQHVGRDAAEFGIIRKYTALGWGLSGVLGGCLQDHFGDASLFVLVVVAQAMSVTLLLALPMSQPEPRPREASPRDVSLTESLRSPKVLLFFANLFIYGVCASSVEIFLIVYLLQDFPTASNTLVGATFAMMTVAEIPVFHFSDRFLRFGFVAVFAACHLVFALRCCLYSLLPTAHPWIVLVVEPLHGLTAAAFFATAVHFGRLQAREGSAARFQALISGTYFQLSFGVGSLTWAPVMQNIGYRLSYRVVAVCVVAWCLIWNTAQLLQRTTKSSELTVHLVH